MPEDGKEKEEEKGAKRESVPAPSTEDDPFTAGFIPERSLPKKKVDEKDGTDESVPAPSTEDDPLAAGFIPERQEVQKKK